MIPAPMPATRGALYPIRETFAGARPELLVKCFPTWKVMTHKVVGGAVCCFPHAYQQYGDVVVFQLMLFRQSAGLVAPVCVWGTHTHIRGAVSRFGPAVCLPRGPSVRATSAKPVWLASPFRWSCDGCPFRSVERCPSKFLRRPMWATHLTAMLDGSQAKHDLDPMGATRFNKQQTNRQQTHPGTLVVSTSLMRLEEQLMFYHPYTTTMPPMPLFQR